jgi:SAM-dependent methyltransferase
MRRRVSRPGVREGYDQWAEFYDDTPNPLVALDRRHTLGCLQVQQAERVLDAGCGTGVHLLSLVRAGGSPVGIDLSREMLRVAQGRVPGVPLAQADMNRGLPVDRGVFDAFMCSLVSEHLTNLRMLFTEAFAVVRSGGRMVFSAFHPEMAAVGIEANFEVGGQEYRLGAEPHTVADYVDHIHDAGFRDVRCSEYCVDAALVDDIPWAQKYLGRPLLLIIQGVSPSFNAA